MLWSLVWLHPYTNHRFVLRQYFHWVLTPHIPPADLQRIADSSRKTAAVKKCELYWCLELSKVSGGWVLEGLSVGLGARAGPANWWWVRRSGSRGSALSAGHWVSSSAQTGQTGLLFLAAALQMIQRWSKIWWEQFSNSQWPDKTTLQTSGFRTVPLPSSSLSPLWNHIARPPKIGITGQAPPASCLSLPATLPNIFLDIGSRICNDRKCWRFSSSSFHQNWERFKVQSSNLLLKECESPQLLPCNIFSIGAVLVASLQERYEGFGEGAEIY